MTFCPACRQPVRRIYYAETCIVQAWSCDCGLIFLQAFWLERDGELYPARRHPSEQSSSSTSGT
jgi:hypothetical protein